MSRDKEARILFFINDLSFFVSHRLDLALGLEKNGYEVHIAGPLDMLSNAKLESCGFIVHSIFLNRFSFNPISELRTLYSMCAVIASVKPNIVHSVTIKPVIYGTVAARILRVEKIVNAISGLGFVFLSKGYLASIRRLIVVMMYRAAFAADNIKIIFQNTSDRKLFFDKQISKPSNYFIIPGSGVNKEFIAMPPLRLTAKIIILIASRILREKGFYELILASKRLWNDGIPFELIVCGELPINNPGAVDLADFTEWGKLPFITFLGKTECITETMAKSQICCLPSYREGYSRFLVESLASGRALVTTNVPGCKEMVDQGNNGLLVKPRDAETLYSSLKELLLNPAKIKSMGEQSKVKFFNMGLDNENLIKKTLELYTSI